MAKQENKTISILLLLLIVVGGGFLIKFALEQPCEVGPITQTVMGQTATIEQPQQMQKLICLGTDIKSIIAMIAGAAMLGTGITKLIGKI